MPANAAEASKPDAVLSKSAVSVWIGVSLSTLDRWCRNGLFPPKTRLGPSRVGWPQSIVEEWLSARR